MDMIDKLRDTAQSHDRCSVVEVMGRKAGFIAVNVAIAVGAEACITVERPYDLDAIAAKMVKTKNSKGGKHHFIIVVAEGVGGVEEIAKRIEAETGVESRATILGHVQRGGSPNAYDRVLSTQFGVHAAELIRDEVYGVTVALKGNEISHNALKDIAGVPKPVPEDDTMVRIAKTMGISFGN